MLQRYRHVAGKLFTALYNYLRNNLKETLTSKL